MEIWLLTHAGRFRPSGLAAVRPSWGLCSFALAEDANVRVLPCPAHLAGDLPGWLAGRARRLPVPPPDTVLVDSVLGISTAASARFGAESGVPVLPTVLWRLEALARALEPLASTGETWIFWPEGLPVRAPAQAMARVALGFMVRLSREVRLTRFPAVGAGGPERAHSSPGGMPGGSGYRSGTRNLEEVRQVILETSGTPCHIVDRPETPLWAFPGPPAGPCLAYFPGNGGGSLAVDILGVLETASPARLVPEPPAGAVLTSVGADLPAGVTFSPPAWPVHLPLTTPVARSSPLPASIAEALVLSRLGPAALRALQRAARDPTSPRFWHEAAYLYGRAASGLLPTYRRWAWRHLNFLTKGGKEA